jgi:hypothetical protein
MILELSYTSAYLIIENTTIYLQIESQSSGHPNQHWAEYTINLIGLIQNNMVPNSWQKGSWLICNGIVMKKLKYRLTSAKH